MYLGDATAYQSMSDSELDDTYAAAYDGFRTATGHDKVAWSYAMSNAAIEITDRLSSVGSFITGFFGSTRFPRYDAIQKSNPSMGGFQQSLEAQTAVKTQAQNVASSAVSALKFGGVVAISLGAAAIALLIITRRK